MPPLPPRASLRVRRDQLYVQLRTLLGALMSPPRKMDIWQRGLDKWCPRLTLAVGPCGGLALLVWSVVSR